MIRAYLRVDIFYVFWLSFIRSFCRGSWLGFAIGGHPATMCIYKVRMYMFYVRRCVCMYVCMYVRMFVCTYTCMYDGRM